MKRAFVCAAMLVCVLCMAVNLTAAEETGGDKAAEFVRIYDYAVVERADKVNMRVGPGANYDWVSVARLGDWVGVLGEQDNWYYAYIPECNQYGYMSKNYLTLRDDTVVPAAGVVANPQAGEKTFLRTFPSFQASVVKECENGLPLTLVSVSGDGWYEVEIEGERGFLHSETVKLTEIPNAETATLQAPGGGMIWMRNRPYFLGSQITGQFLSGSRAAVLLKSSAEDSFWKVMVNGQTGFVPARFVKLDSALEDEYAEAEQTVALTQSVALRGQPSRNARVIGRCSGEGLRVIAAGETWSRVYDGESRRAGYCLTKYLSLSGQPALAIRTVQSEDAFLYLNLDGNNAPRRGFAVPKDAEVTVLTPGDVWSQVRFAGTVGYIKTETLQ